MRRPNIVFLTVDALRADRIGILGYERPTTPNIDSLAKTGLVCTKAYALAPSTQPSFPAIFTSTKPLSFGGYDEGIRNRPNPLAAILSSNSYKTAHLVTFPWASKRYGYGVGVSVETSLYDLRTIVTAVLKVVKSLNEAFLLKAIDEQTYCDLVSPVVKHGLEDIIFYARERMTLEGYKLAQLNYRKLENESFNYESVLASAKKHLYLLEDNQKNYLLRFILPLSVHDFNTWINSELGRSKTLSGYFRQIGESIWKTILYTTKTEAAARIFSSRYKTFIDGEELTNKIITQAKEFLDTDPELPFYIWAHYLDTHSPYCPGEFPDWTQSIKRHLVGAGHDIITDLSVLLKKAPQTEGEALAWSNAYDASVRYVDKQIGRVVSALKAFGVLENTIIVIAGDHGEELGEHGDYGHRFRFYEECVRVPIIISGKNVAPLRFSGLSDLLDIAPTILDLLGINIPGSYQGRSLLGQKAGKSHIQMEVFNRGGCQFKTRPIYAAVRTENYKYIWREWIDREDNVNSSQEELYDLLGDPQEKNDISQSSPNVCISHQRIIDQRLSVIPEYSIARGSNRRTL